MNNLPEIKEDILINGYTIIEDVFTKSEIDELISIIEKADTSKPTFRKTNGLFAIRQFLKEVPAISNKVFNHKLKKILSELFGDDYFIVKSIYSISLKTQIGLFHIIRI